MLRTAHNAKLRMLLVFINTLISFLAFLLMFDSYSSSGGILVVAFGVELVEQVEHAGDLGLASLGQMNLPS